MSRIYIVGIVASGKTTLAKALSKQFNIPHYELDCIVHTEKDGERYKRAPEECVEEINRIDSLGDWGDWIIEGTYRQSCKCLLDISDKIIFLDPPLWLRKVRIVTRSIKQGLHMEHCHYKPDLHMLKMMFKWTKDFGDNRKDFEKLLEQYEYKLTRITR
ncbi:MAG: hypothetical protein LBU94_01055 [Clostridiales bacterium]|jgi:adenylate kinase family enzyme|nr:hypothetical protein [Clostridiales bacterium]